MSRVPTNSPTDYGVRFVETQYWVIHRRGEYGPFDYQWSSDLYGVELFFQGEKFGECCNAEQFFADLKPFRLPHRVTEVAMTVAGILIQGAFASAAWSERHQRVADRLSETGLGRYIVTVKQSPESDAT